MQNQIRQSIKRSVIIGCGSFLPKKRVTNLDLEKVMETSDEWIRERTGIQQRYIADVGVEGGELTSDLAYGAALDCLKNAGKSTDIIDMIIVATTTPDLTFPATATRVQAKLGLNSIPCFDLQAVCSGFLYGLSVADAYLKSGLYKTILVIGAETFSRLLDWEDRRTAVLFGDGAGAVLLSAEDRKPEDVGTTQDIGILSTHLYSDGSQTDILCTTGGPSKTQSTGVTIMQGQEVFKLAVKHMSAACEVALSHNHVTVGDVTWVVPHQANQRILDALAKKLSIPTEKVISTVHLHANTSAASIPLALAHSLRENKFKKGDLLLMTAIGGGLSWGSALIRWGI